MPGLKLEKSRDILLEELNWLFNRLDNSTRRVYIVKINAIKAELERLETLIKIRDSSQQ